MRVWLSISLMVWTAAPSVGLGQLVTEVIDLRAGWNAVWLNVEPEPNGLDAILALQEPMLDVQAIWTFDANRSVSASLTGTEAGRWFLHAKDVPPSLNSLRVLQGSRGYLIHMRAEGSLQLTGRPSNRSRFFTSRGSNLFGALTGSTMGTLTFEKFFSHPKAVGKIRASGTPIRHDIFAMSGDLLVRKGLTDSIQPNTAYWLNVVQDFEYAGPLDFASNSNGLSFGRSTSLRTLSIEVPLSETPRTLRLQSRPCAVLSETGECSGSTGSAEWLQFREVTQPGLPIWRPLAEGLSLVVPAGMSRVELDVRPRRAGLESRRRRRGGEASEETFALVVDLSDERGSRAVLLADVSIEPVFGRWVGRATLTQVSTHPSIQTLPLEEAEATPMSMTLLLDLPDPIAVQGGATPRLLDSVSIASFRDGRPLVRRFESVLFDRPVALTPDSSDPLDPFGAGGTLHGTLHILPIDPLNPYRHRYNPEHRSGYDITRQITVKIETQKDRPVEQLAGLDGTLGSQRLTGQYSEVITGVTEQPITIRGTFRLDRLIGQPSPGAAE